MTEEVAASRGKKIAGTVLRVAVTVAIVVAIVLAVRSQWSEVRDTILSLGIWSLLGSSLLVFLGMGAAVRAWQHALGALDYPIPAFDAARCPAASGHSFFRPSWSDAPVSPERQDSWRFWSPWD
jgi:hypothetical protein